MDYRVLTACTLFFNQRNCDEGFFTGTGYGTDHRVGDPKGDQSMAIDTATLTLAAQPAHVATCELCATVGVVVAAAAVVRHSRGGAVQLAACDRCERGLRRLTAAIGGAVLVEASAEREVAARVPS